MQIPFTKMQGAGNAYLYVENIHTTLPTGWECHIPHMCDVRYGVGADGVILASASQKGDIRMTMYNRDGSTGAMCGNGIRCLARLAFDRGWVASPVVHVETACGVREVRLYVEKREVKEATVAMGAVSYAPEDVPYLGVGYYSHTYRGRDYVFVPLSVGNPHAVCFTEAFSACPKELCGEVEKAPEFPDGVNVELVKVISPTHLKMWVWERGTGATPACGTGATACVAVGVKRGICSVGERILVEMPGGCVTVTPLPRGHFLLSGDANYCCQGVYYGVESAFSGIGE